MSSRKSHPQHNDPHLNRLPYEQGPRQGRFGRVENWREAEKRQAEQVKRHRQEHSRRSGQKAAEQHPEDVPESNRRVQRPKRKPVEPNPWQQGRFGRVENWRDVQRDRERKEQAEQERASRIDMAKDDASSIRERRASKQQLQPSGQQTVAAKEGTQRRAEASESREASRAAAQRRREASAQAESRIKRTTSSSAQRHANATRSASVAQRQKAAPRSSQPSTKVPASEQKAASQPQASQKAAHAKKSDAQPERSAGKPQEVSSQARESQQDSVAAVIRADEKLKYSRSSYVKNLRNAPIGAHSVTRNDASKYDRRPDVDYPADRRKSLTGRLPHIPMKIVGAVAAVLVVLVIVGAVLLDQRDNEAMDLSAITGGGNSAQAVSLPTPIMSESSGITMHSAVAMEDLTEILIHNASYAYANEITTQLAEAHNDDIIAAHGTGRIASEQPTGDSWMTGEFIRCFRSGNAGPVMSAIDCGGPVGATVYAPVTGTVVLVKEYKLYDEIDDFRVHIQPTGRPDLDVVLIHLTDVSVKAGDQVTAGVTPIAKIRDIFQYLDESLQLKLYTSESDNGNHTHIQVNNANHPEYTALNELKPQPVDPPAAATP